MKQAEVMIGDWVIPCIFGADSKPSKIVGIQYNSYRGKDYVDWVDCEVWDELGMDDIKPIPLTQEILEKNGFVKLGKQYDIWCMRDFNFSLKLLDGVFGYYEQGQPYTPTFKTKYVHELQHALHLWGIEKEIVL